VVVHRRPGEGTTSVEERNMKAGLHPVARIFPGRGRAELVLPGSSPGPPGTLFFSIRRKGEGGDPLRNAEAVYARTTIGAGRLAVLLPEKKKGDGRTYELSLGLREDGNQSYFVYSFDMKGCGSHPHHQQVKGSGLMKEKGRERSGDVIFLYKNCSIVLMWSKERRIHWYDRLRANRGVRMTIRNQARSALVNGGGGETQFGEGKEETLALESLLGPRT